MIYIEGAVGMYLVAGLFFGGMWPMYRDIWLTDTRGANVRQPGETGIELLIKMTLVGALWPYYVTKMSITMYRKVAHPWLFEPKN